MYNIVQICINEFQALQKLCKLLHSLISVYKERIKKKCFGTVEIYNQYLNNQQCESVSLREDIKPNSIRCNFLINFYIVKIRFKRTKKFFVVSHTTIEYRFDKWISAYFNHLIYLALKGITEFA
ncbi:hypothetical protein BpHYR1_043726, partial [Brachionus plicatilis]